TRRSSDLDQLTAMEIMAVDPMRYVAAPRFLGGVIAMPLLTAIFSVVGLYGAQLIGVQLMGVDRGVFWSQMQDSVELRNVTEGVVKSLDRKSTRLNSSHVAISYAVFCLKKK